MTTKTHTFETALVWTGPSLILTTDKTKTFQISQNKCLKILTFFWSKYIENFSPCSVNSAWKNCLSMSKLNLTSCVPCSSVYKLNIGSFLTFDFLLRKVLIEFLLFSKIRCLSLMFGLTSWFSM